jgi:hypothetical protein
MDINEDGVHCFPPGRIFEWKSTVTIPVVLGGERKNKKVSFLRNLVNRWNRIGCAGHFGAHHKWWQVLLFWAAVALAALALLALRD